MSRLTKEEILKFPQTTYGRALGKTIASKVMNELLQYKDLEEEIGCPLEEIVEFVKLLKKYYYVDITGQLMARTIWNNTDLNEKELYKINHIFNGIKDKSE